jgi:hypothetical protein
MGNREERIWERAYRIWEEEGPPEGRQEEHWRRAEIEVEDSRSRTLSPRGTPEIPEAAAPGAPPPIDAAKPARKRGGRAKG